LKNFYEYEIIKNHGNEFVNYQWEFHVMNHVATDMEPHTRFSNEYVC